MVFVVVGDPGPDPIQNGVGVGTGLHAGIVALERFNERLAHPVALRRAHRCEARHETQGCCEGQCLGGCEGRAVVGQPLHGMGGAQAAEAHLDAGQHEIAHHLAGDPARRGHPGDDLAVMGVNGEGHPHISPFQQAIFSPSEDQRWFEAGAITRPSWARTARLPVWRWRSRLSRFIKRNTRLWFSAGSPVARRVRLRIAVTRR